MKSIRSITTNKVGRNNGCTCDKCGLWITEIVTVKYSDGTAEHFGTTCFNKMWLSEKLWTRLEKAESK